MLYPNSTWLLSGRTTANHNHVSDYSQRWRNFAIGWAYIGFNIAGATLLYYLFRVRHYKPRLLPWVVTACGQVLHRLLRRRSGRVPQEKKAENNRVLWYHYLVRGSTRVSLFIQSGKHGDYKSVVLHWGRDTGTSVFSEDQSLLQVFVALNPPSGVENVFFLAFRSYMFIPHKLSIYRLSITGVIKDTDWAATFVSR